MLGRHEQQKQFNKPYATKLYRQIVEDYPNSPYANQAKTRLAELEKAREPLHQGAWSPALPGDTRSDIVTHSGPDFSSPPLVSQPGQ